MATEEIEIGDNDTLGAVVAVSVQADLLVLLTDIDGLYTADPHTHPDAKLLPVVEVIDDKLLAMAGGSTSGLGTGGMNTKLSAAKIATAAGCDVVIANGAAPDLLYRIVEGESVGTRFVGRREAQ